MEAIIKVQQLPLILKTPSIYTGANWITSSCNQEAAQWINAWPEWEEIKFLCLYGEEGSGKTHLAHIWQEKAQALYLNARSITSLSPYEVTANHNAFVLEDANRLENQEWLFHFYNCVKENQSYFLMTSRQAPKLWPVTLPDLQSRLATVAAIEVGVPDETLLAAVLKKQLEERGLRVIDPVIEYLINRTDRSFTSITSWAYKLDRYTAATKRPITIPLLRELLNEETTS